MKRIIFSIAASFLLFACVSSEKKVETVFYPPLPESPKLQFLHSITGEEDIGKSPSAFKEFLLGKTPSMKRIARPYDIAAVKGKIYISDRTYQKILIINLEKKEFDYIKAERAGAIGDLAGIWVTEDDIKYAADMKGKQVVVFDKNNDFLRAYSEPGQFEKPTDVAVYKDKVYVCDFTKSQIIVLDKKSGKTIQTIGKLGDKDGYFNRPTHVVVDKEGNIYVNDSFNFRIQKFDPKGNFLNIYGYQGDMLGSFARPKGIDLDKDGHIYAVDAAFENVQIFDEKSTLLLLFFGGFGPAQGSMYLPDAVYIDYYNIEYFKDYVDKDFKIKYLVYVGNTLGDKKLNIYAFGEWIGAPLPEVKPKELKELKELKEKDAKEGEKGEKK